MRVKIAGIKGLTFAELLTVVIIVAILASIALPLYHKAVERGRQAEAYVILNSLREYQLKYYLEKGEYINNLANTTDWWDDRYYYHGVGSSLPFFKYFCDFGFKNPDMHSGQVARVVRRHTSIDYNEYPTDNHPWGPYQIHIYLNGATDITP